MHKILVVDDDVSVHYIMKRIIESQGHQVRLSSSLDEGLRMAAQEHFSVVFLDIFLPDGNGLSALAEFKKSPGHPEVVLITGLGSEEDAEKAMRIGAYDYISKKTPVDDITEILTQAMACREADLRRHTMEAATGYPMSFNRKDLYYRLQACVLTLPPLSQRVDDIDVLTHRFLERLLREHGLPAINVSQAFINCLELYRWDGNVRELKNAIEYAVSAGRFSGELLPHHLPSNIRIHATKRNFAARIRGGVTTPLTPQRLSDEDTFPSFEQYRKAMGAQLEKNYINQAYRMARGDVKKMMALSRLSKSRCYSLIKTHVKPKGEKKRTPEAPMGHLGGGNPSGY